MLLLARLNRGDGVDRSQFSNDMFELGAARGVNVKKLGLASDGSVGNTPRGAAPPFLILLKLARLGEVAMNDKRLGEAWACCDRLVLEDDALGPVVVLVLLLLL